MKVDVGEQKEKKKGRKRVKAILAKIKDQMEFYFSDSNLHKDRFLKKAIEATTDGYIELKVFLQFNRIRTLTDEVKMIADAVAYKSELLQLNEDRTKVKRTKPLSEPKNVDERTVYVEYLPSTADHEWVRKVFSACGKVTYVSLPKFQTTGDLKGFAFVEFETEEAAKLACEELNNPPVEAGPRIGMFPKSNKPLEALKKKLPEDQIKETEERAKSEVQTEEGSISDSKDTTESRTDETPDSNTETVSTGILKRVKRSRTKSEGSVDDSFSGNDSSPQKRKRLEVSFDLPDDSDKSSKRKSRKRKNRSKTVDVAQVSQDLDKTEKESSEVEKPELNRSGNGKETQEKRQKVDTDLDVEKTDVTAKHEPENKSETRKDPDCSVSKKRKTDNTCKYETADVEKTDVKSKHEPENKSETRMGPESSVGKKRKADSTNKSETAVTEIDERQQKKRRKDSIKDLPISSESQTESKIEGKIDGGTEVVAKKKKHRRRRKQHKQKEVPELRVIPKSEWLHLREEYLRLQKASMAMLKRTLTEMKDESNTKTPKEDEKKKRQEIEFIPNVIVKVISDKPLVRKKLKNDLGGGVAIAYIDVTDGLFEGHVRCQNAESAKQIESQNIDSLGFSILAGNDEKMYWEKLKSDRGKKLSNKSRNKKRGHDKWMDKAQKTSLENVERQHIVFDDD